MTAPAQEPATRSWWTEHSELGVSALLGAVGVLVLVNTLLETRSGGSDSDPLGPHAVPLLVGGLLVLLSALLTIDVLRGGKGEAEAGDDIDLEHPADKRTVGLLAGVVLATAVLIPLIGWPIAGAGLFWGATYALGSRSFPRDPLIAAGVSLVTWIVFDALLGVDLPGGPFMSLFGGVVMDTLSNLFDGFGHALTPGNLLFAAIGVLLGTAIGVLPGIGPAMALALLLPVTYAFDPTGAFIMFAGIYFGGMFGGSTTSILLNTPGESAAVVAAIEGNPMARSGRGPQALAAAAIGHFVGGLVGTILLVILAPVVASLAVGIGAPDYVAVMVLAFVAVTSVLGSSRVRGFASLAIGLAIGLVGLDPLTGAQRLTFGIPQLADGIDVVIVAVGIFAVGEALWVAAHLRREAQQVIPVGQPWLGRADLRRTWKPWLRGPLIGFPFGAIPAGGAEIPTFLSYVLERRLSKHPEEFGTGAIEGVAGPESASSSSAAGTLTAMLTIGLPTTATAAVMLAAFQQFGIQPGPLLFQRESQLVWTLVASMFIGLVLLLVLNLPLAPVWAKLLRIPRPYLYAGILFFASIGAYAVSGQPIDLVVLLVIGAIGFGMRRYGLPVLPAVLGVILGPDAELQLRRALQIADGDPLTLVSTPFAIIVYIVMLAVLVVPAVRALRGRRAQPAETQDPKEEHLSR